MSHKTPTGLFDDNNVDDQRSEQRTYWDGQAEHCGKYDRIFCYGIFTTFYHKYNQQQSYSKE